MDFLYHSRDSYFKSPFGAVPTGDALLFRAGVARSLPIKEVYLRLHREGGADYSFKGYWTDLRLGLDIYRFDVFGLEAGLYFYFFETHFQDDGWDAGQSYQLTVYNANYETPPWLKQGVMYQIFPDRFARSKAYLPPVLHKQYTLREDWGGLPDYKPDEHGIIQNNDFFGGNLLGIISKLDYLKSLGVTVIYLNPIVEAYSNHRYDTGHFKKVDPMLGTLDDFRALCEKCTAQGIHVILDGVFNHTGSDSLYFNKDGSYPEIGAYQSKTSPYYPWYKFSDYPGRYEAWWGIATLPQVNELEKSYLDYILLGEDSVVKFWLKAGASGFRLDVADELPSEFIEALRITVKSINPDAAIIGEVWENAANKISYGTRRKYFLGNELDSVMNYPVKDALIRFVKQENQAEDLSRILDELREDYPSPAFNSLMNSLGTHDTPRILTVLGSDERLQSLNKDEKAHHKLTMEQETAAKKRLFNMLIIWAFLPGIPCIYYGDELGMQGAVDPFNRGCLEDNKGDSAIQSYYKALLAFRESIRDIGHMAFKSEQSKGGVYAFSRSFQNSVLQVRVNAGTAMESLRIEDWPTARNKSVFINGHVVFTENGLVELGEQAGFICYYQN